MSGLSKDIGYDFFVRVELLRSFSDACRDLPPLSPKDVEAHLDRHQRDVAAACRSLAGLVGSRDPHERVIGDDSHITGKIGGLDKRKYWHRVKPIWIGDKSHVGRIRYNIPITRVGRPMNANGSSAIYFAFESISKAQVVLGLANSQGHKVSPVAHVEYIERIEAHEDYVDRVIDLTAAKADDYVRYQEGHGAIPSGGAVSQAQTLFTNIPGSAAERADSFRKMSEIETTDREPSLTLDLSCKSAFMKELRADFGYHAAIDPATIEPLVFRGADAEVIAGMLGKRGWRDTRKKSEKQSRSFDSDGVCYDPGKSGTVQFRLVGELPHDVSHEARARIVKGICAEFERRRLPYIAVIHAPGPENNERNWHFHIVYHDRPIAIFDGTAATHLICEDANGEIPESKVSAKRRHLNDPDVQAQVGKWDFEVVAYRVHKRQRFPIFPYRQRKDRDVTRQEFVPALRSKLCDLTNAEFERCGIARRVDPLSHAKARRKATPGKKLGSALHSREMSGIPTAIGMDNEDSQWRDRTEVLFDQYLGIIDRYRLTQKEEAQIRSFLPDGRAALRVIVELQMVRKECAELKRYAAEARELTDRLFSRSNAVAQRNHNLMIEELRRKTPNLARMAAFEQQFDHASQHQEAMRLLGGDLFEIAADADKKIEEREARIRELEIQGGLRPAYVFDDELTQATAGAAQSQLEDIREATEDASMATEAALPAVDADVGFAHQPDQYVEADLVQACTDSSTPPLDPSAPPADTSILLGPDPKSDERASPTAERIASADPTPIAVPAPPKSHHSPARPAKAAEHARRRRISEQLGIVFRNRVPFELSEEFDGDTKTVIALIDPAIAAQNGLPQRIEAREKHEQQRLIGIDSRRKAAATFKAVFQDPEAAIWGASEAGARSIAPRAEEPPVVNASADAKPSGRADPNPLVDAPSSAPTTGAPETSPKAVDAPVATVTQDDPARGAPIADDASMSGKESAGPAIGNDIPPTREGSGHRAGIAAPPSVHEEQRIPSMPNARTVDSAEARPNRSEQSPDPSRSSPPQSAPNPKRSSNSGPAPEAIASLNEILSDIDERRLFLRRKKSGKIGVMLGDRDVSPDVVALIFAPKVQQILSKLYARQQEELRAIATDLVVGKIKLTKDENGRRRFSIGDLAARDRIRPWIVNGAFLENVAFVMQLPTLQGRNTREDIAIRDHVCAVLRHSLKGRTALKSLTDVVAAGGSNKPGPSGPAHRATQSAPTSPAAISPQRQTNQTPAWKDALRPPQARGGLASSRSVEDHKQPERKPWE